MFKLRRGGLSATVLGGQVQRYKHFQILSVRWSNGQFGVMLRDTQTSNDDLLDVQQPTQNAAIADAKRHIDRYF